jgi:hypothetical protein
VTGRIEVIARMSGRQFWTIEQKLANGARRVRPWRIGTRRDRTPRSFERPALHLAQEGDVGLLFGPPLEVLPAPEHLGFAEVLVIEPLALAPPVLAASALVAAPACRIAIELPCGIKLSGDAAVDADPLGQVLSALQR